MNASDLVDPELLPLLGAFPVLELDEAGLQTARERPSLPVHETEGVLIEERRVPGPPGAPEVRVVIWRPTQPQASGAGLLHIHSGGYVLGKPEDFAFRYVPLVAELRVTVVSVDYRLAPETRAPGAVEDCLAALRWFAGSGRAELNVNPTSIGVIGESARPEAEPSLNLGD